ncbi:MAG TPA: DUF4093 domain-containing protein [Candidatus Avimonas sp.]|jgi:ribonuclease M5|nr:DUF4093 domain-containing protein [Clostridiales bacterium]HOB36052.1 DUF4093 domain-containing protein [Candidatus Avimonas sp.]HQA15502.1 DUF4093 domain-containing protein [Candidatus Avimonas sp.]HQD37532.1 DUF4093 domain-containing protein [Candidatus Avimonas sp.]
MNKLKIREAVVVEGKHDKIRLAAAVDTLVIETRGFGIFKDSELLGLLRMIARERGLIILTDSDTAGFVIRNYLSGAIPPEQVKHAYIPAVFGKERRKSRRSKEGLLGVEGVDIRAVRDAILNAGATVEGGGENTGGDNPITRLDLYNAGLIGGKNSRKKRALLLDLLGLPRLLSTGRLVAVLNTIMTKEVFERTVRDLCWL